MRVLGIDLGLKRTGLALSDSLGLSVRILPNLVAKTRALMLEKLLSLVHEFDIEAIVIGKPQPLSKDSAAIAHRAEGLYVALRTLSENENIMLKVILLDEDYSSKAGLKSLIASGVGRKQRKIKLDGAAAAIMVERYLAGPKMQE